MPRLWQNLVVQISTMYSKSAQVVANMVLQISAKSGRPGCGKICTKTTTISLENYCQHNY